MQCTTTPSILPSNLISFPGSAAKCWVVVFNPLQKTFWNLTTFSTHDQQHEFSRKKQTSLIDNNNKQRFSKTMWGNAFCHNITMTFWFPKSSNTGTITSNRRFLCFLFHVTSSTESLNAPDLDLGLSSLLSIHKICYTSRKWSNF